MKITTRRIKLEMYNFKTRRKKFHSSNGKQRVVREKSRSNTKQDKMAGIKPSVTIITVKKLFIYT